MIAPKESPSEHSMVFHLPWLIYQIKFKHVQPAIAMTGGPRHFFHSIHFLCIAQGGTHLGAEWSNH